MEELALGYIAGRRGLLTRRIAEGWVRDGHGDLLAEDVFCLDDGPRFLDCLAFDDRLRHADVLADAAFLAMDIEAHGAEGLGRLMLEAWSRALGETHPASLADHYVAYRAHVRAKVACLRHLQGDPEAAHEARRLHELCLRHLEQARVRLVLVGGAPGTGQSTVAAALGERTGWHVLRSDVVRARVAGPRAGAAAGRVRGRPLRPRAPGRGVRRPGRGGCRAARGGRVGDPRRVLVGRGGPRPCPRGGAIHLVRDRGDPLRGALRTVARRRIAERAARGDDPSEATPAIARRVAADADPWPEAEPLDTDRPLSETVADALRLIG